MPAQIELLNAVKAKIAALFPDFPGVIIGQMPASGGLSMEPTAGHNDSIYLNRDAKQIIPILLLSKHKDQQTTAGRLFSICNALQRATEYGSGDTWEWIKAETATTPQFIEREGGTGLYLYSAIVNIEFILKE